MQTEPTLYLTQGSGNSFKPMLVLQQTTKTCRYQYIDVLAGETRQSAYLDINPQGVVPFLTLPGGDDLGESNAIAWYLAEGTELMPQTSYARAQTIRWMSFEQTALEANISPVRFFSYIAPERQEECWDMMPAWQEQGDKALAVLDSYLKNRDFITDDGYCVADIAVFGYTHLADEGGFDLDNYASVSKWIERVINQPHYQPISTLLDGSNTVSIAA